MHDSHSKLNSISTQWFHLSALASAVLMFSFVCLFVCLFQQVGSLTRQASGLLLVFRECPRLAAPHEAEHGRYILFSLSQQICANEDLPIFFFLMRLRINEFFSNEVWKICIFGQSHKVMISIQIIIALIAHSKPRLHF